MFPSKTNDLDEFLAKKVRFFRLKMNWPLKTLAAHLNISLQQLQRYEQGVNKISASFLFDLSKAFQVNIQDFFDGYLSQEITNPKTFNILLIEDSPDDEFLFRKALEEFPEKLDIYVLKDGEEAYNFFLNMVDNFTFSKPDIIFMDLNLPGIKGLDLLKEIKRKPILQDIPVVMLTTSLNDEDMVQSYHLQASGFIRKSFNFQSFCENLHQTLTYWVKTVSLPRSASFRKVAV